MVTFDPVPDAAVRARLAEQAHAVHGRPSAGIFGDVAGRELPPQPINLSAAAPVSADPEQLLALLQRQQEQINALLAAQPAPAGPADPPDITPRLGNASGELQAAFAGIHARLLNVEKAAGIDAAKALAEQQQ